MNGSLMVNEWLMVNDAHDECHVMVKDHGDEIRVLNDGDFHGDLLGYG